MSKTYSAGIATAYGAAKRGGYQGSYTDFCNDIAELGNITEELGNISAEATTLEVGSDATASYNGGVFTFGIPTSNGIVSVTKTGTSGLVDTYTITFTDGTTTTFDVTNGAEALDDTLSIAGRAADAKATGDEISDLKSDLDALGLSVVSGTINITYEEVTA